MRTANLRGFTVSAHSLLFSEWSEAERIAFDAERNVFHRSLRGRTATLPSVVECIEAASLRALANSLGSQLASIIDEIRTSLPPTRRAAA